jgi:hypothetical protein
MVTRDLKMLLVVVAGAAFAGWVVVRLVSPGADAPAPEVAVTTNSDRPVEVASTDANDPTAPPAVADDDPPEAEGDGDPEAIVRDLDVLARAMRTDKFVHNRAFPDNKQVLELPSVIHYVRAVEFWNPAFTPDTGGNR